MKYLLSIVLLALIGVTTPKKTTPAYDWGSVSAKPDLSWADQVGAQRTPKNTEWDAGKFGLRNDTSVFHWMLYSPYSEAMLRVSIFNPPLAAA